MIGKMTGATVFFVRRVGHWFQITCAMITVTVSFTVPVAAWFMISKEDLRNRYGHNGQCDCKKKLFLASMECSTSLYGRNVRRPFDFIASLFPVMLLMLTFESSLHL